MLQCAQKVAIQKYLVDSTNDNCPVMTEIVALSLECVLLGSADSSVKLCKGSVQKAVSFCILL